MKSKKMIEVNIPNLLRAISENKKKLCICICITAVVAVIVAFSIPRIYKSRVILAPESSSTGGLSSFSSLADMVGINLDMASENDAIYPEIYPDLISSNDFLVSLFDCKVKSLDGKINTTYYDYIKNMQKQPWWMYSVDLVKDLIKKISSPVAKKSGKGPNPFMLTKEEDDIAKYISQNIKCSVDKKTSVITIEVTAQDPLIAAEMTEIVKGRLQQFITNYRTKKARADMEYTKMLCNDAYSKYEEKRKEYARFCDSSLDISLPSYTIKQEELENEMSLAFSTYRQLSEQLNMTQAKVLERTPAFTIVQMASVPVKHSNMPKAIILLLFEIFGVALFIGYISYKNRKEIFFIP